LTRAQEILSLHEGIIKKAAKGAAYGYIGYKIAKPLLPKIASVLKPVIGGAHAKAKELGFDPQMMKSYGKDFINTNVVPHLRNKGYDLSGFIG
jgi:hypothetical protein